MSVRFYLEAFDHGVSDMLVSDREWVETTNILSADVVVFTGGDDVNPELYGEEQHHSTYSSPKRHEKCMLVYQTARVLGVPLIGICRGSQFLTVMAGHRLWQNVSKHAVGGTHTAYDMETRETFQVTSTHHQMMRLSPHGEGASRILAAAELGSHRETMGTMKDDYSELEIEAMWHPQINAFSYQPHPEYLPPTHRCRTKFWEYVDSCFPNLKE